MFDLLKMMLFVTSLMTSSYASPATTMRVYVREDAKVDALVASTVDLLGLSKASPSGFQLLSQKLMTPNQAVEGTPLRHKWLSLDEQNGDVTLRHRVDREDLCGDVDQCVIYLQIFAIDQQQLLNLHVIIDDVNDNLPIFPTHRITLNVSESAPIGEILSLDQFLAEDADIGNNSKIIYSIKPNNYFQLEQIEDKAITIHLQLKVIQKLDYEQNSIERLTLTARDRGIPSLRSNMQVQIRILDVNDNTPVFEQSEYSVKLLENLYPSVVIIRVKAHDADSDGSGLIRYSISRMNKPKARQLVDIDPESGDVILKATLDRETHDKMKIMIEARDSSPINQKVGRTWLTIRVDDVNDNAPTININFIATSVDDAVYLPEDYPVGTYFAYITATDVDLDDNGKVRIKIKSASSENGKTGVRTSSIDTFVFTQDGFLSLSKSLDREIRSRYTIVMEACDFGSPSRCSRKTLLVILLDINDNEPVFTNTKRTFSLLEDSPAGTVVTTVHANDNDANNPPAIYKNVLSEIAPSPYGEVSYHIIDGDGTFSIHSRTGEITLSKPIDRESIEKYLITVRAKDGDSEVSLETRQQLTIIVGDVNDNKPSFINPSTDNSTVYATILRNDVIMRVQAVDYDEGRNGFVQYKISSEDGVIKSRTQLSSLFTIDSTSGDLKLNSSNPKLNSSLGIHTVVVQASDNGTNYLRSHCAIEVIITDLEKLPLVTAVDLNAASVTSSVIIAVALTSSLIVLAIIVSAIACKYRSYRKQKRTYRCRNEAVDSSDWADSSTMSLKKFSEKSHISSRDTSIISKTSTALGWNKSYPKRSDFVKDDFLDDKGSELEANVNASANNASVHVNPKIYCHPALEKRALSVRRKIYYDKIYPTVTRKTSHDGDSGRGDSDPDVAGSDITNDNEFSKTTSSRQSGKTHRSRLNPNPRCTEQCLRYGHSDACWMPDFQKNTEKDGDIPPQYHATSVESPLYVELSPKANPPVYTDFQENQNLATIPETRPVRHFWSFPANDLSSIYSNVVMNAQPQDAVYSRHAANHTPTRHNYVTNDRRPPTVRMSPLSCASTHASIKSCDSDDDAIKISDAIRYPNVTKQHGVIGLDDDSNDMSKRSTVSLFSPSSPRHSSMIRSASADLLGEDSSSELLFSLKNGRHSPDPWPYSHDEGTFGNVSMQETQEIVDNIEKLLDT